MYTPLVTRHFQTLEQEDSMVKVMYGQSNGVVQLPCQGCPSYQSLSRISHDHRVPRLEHLFWNSFQDQWSVLYRH